MELVVSDILSVVAAICMLSGHVVYVWQVRGGHSKPNAASWSIWAASAVVVALSYLALSKDSMLSLWSFACAAACLANFAHSLFRGKLSRIGGYEWVILATCIAALVALEIFNNSKGANLIMAASVVFSFIPTVSNLYQDPSKERPLPWLLWDICYALAMITATLKWKGGVVSLAVPGAHFIGNTWVIMLSWRRKIKLGERSQ